MHKNIIFNLHTLSHQPSSHFKLLAKRSRYFLYLDFEPEQKIIVEITMAATLIKAMKRANKLLSEMSYNIKL